MLEKSSTLRTYLRAPILEFSYIKDSKDDKFFLEIFNHSLKNLITQ